MDTAINGLRFGDISLSGYAGEMISFITNTQYKDPSLWALLANQFKIKSDDDGGWRGEFWGKLMRGACLSYQATKDEELYSILSDTVIDLMSAQEKDGRLSAYPLDRELKHWDVWGRKYAIIGLLEFHQICKSASLKNKILKCAKRSADSIMKKVGNGEGQINILDTSNIVGSLNSASISRAFSMLYRITQEEKYLNFCHYIIDEGFCKGMNLVESCFGDNYPFQFPVRKAYEMTSCIESLIDLYELEGNKRYLSAAIAYGNKIEKTDFTIIGCAGMDGEMFDNSSLTQTKKPARTMQETCVTVTLMAFFYKLLRNTGNAHYADLIERSAYNALFGAINNENQTMKRTHGNVWIGDDCIHAPHGSFPFDSYSPLYMGSRGSVIGGFRLLQDGESYGCCACNGGRGTAITNLFSAMKKDDGLAINFYNDGLVKTKINGHKIIIKTSANLYTKNKVSITVKGDGAKWPLFLRIPEWSDKTAIKVDGEIVPLIVENGYLRIEKSWDRSKVSIEFTMPMKVHKLNGKIAFTKGPIVLARDRRLDNIEEALGKSFHDGQTIRSKRVDDANFHINVEYVFNVKDKTIHLIDYSQAGKDYDDPQSMITVWQNR